MAEEVVQVEAEAGSADATEAQAKGAPEAEAQTSTEAQTVPGLPEGQSLEEYVAQKVAAETEKYQQRIDKIERTDIARLKKQRNQARRKLEEANARQLEEAKAVMQQDPARAAQLAVGAVDQMQQQQQLEQAYQHWSDWAENEAAEAGHDLEDPEVQALLSEQLTSLYEAGMQGPEAAAPVMAEFQKAIYGRKLEATQQEAATAKKELEKMAESMPGLIEQTVLTKLADMGMTPEPTAGDGQSREPEDDTSNLSPSQKIQAGIDQARKERAAKKKALREGK